MDPSDCIVNGHSFAGVRSTDRLDPGTRRTQAHYNMLLDLVIALCNDRNAGRVKYTLMEEEYLALLPASMQQDTSGIALWSPRG